MILRLTDNKRYLKILDCTEAEYDQLLLSFTLRINNWRFHPLVKKGVWDGNICFVKDGLVPSSCYDYLKKIFKSYGFECKTKGIKTRLWDADIDYDEFKQWVADFFEGTKWQPRDYQIDAAFKILKYRRCVAQLATSAGKTLVSFIVFAYMFDKLKMGKILMVVPTTQLVTQGYDDFEEYNSDKLPLNIQMFFAEKAKELKPNTNIVIGTFQTLVNYPPEWFYDFDAVFVDECHKAATANSIQKVLDNLWHCDYRFGMTGTIPKVDTCDYVNMIANLGPIITQVKAKFLQEEGFITKCKIHQVYMNYATEEQRKSFFTISKAKDGQRLYTLEQNFVIESNKRFKYITKVVSKQDNNSLVLFHRTKYGKKLYDWFRENTNKKVYYIDGEINNKTRDEIKKRMEKYGDVIVVGSFSCIGTGLSINRIFNIFFTESYKSQFVIIQAIGRGLRKHKDKDMVHIYDFVDDLSYVYVDEKTKRKKTWKNFTIKHANDRKLLYDEESYPNEKINVVL